MCVGYLALAVIVRLAAGDGCAGNASFPYDASGVQCFGFKNAEGAKDAEGCAEMCCQQIDCNTWQFEAAQHKGCWIGYAAVGNCSKMVHPSLDFQGGQRIIRGPPAPPPVPTPAVSIDDSVGLGPKFAGIGGISGGGATSKLLADYSPEVYSDIMDLLYKPNFGASLHWLKVEMGGDGDATEGSEPSHMRYEGDLNYQRGYEWLMMVEAKKRNPEVILQTLPWTWPGYINPEPKCTGEPWKNMSLAVNYTLAWLKGAKEVYDLDIKYIGNWNEKPQNDTYPQRLQKAIDEAGLKTQAGVYGPHYPGSNNSVVEGGCPAEVYDGMPAPNYVDEEGSAAGASSARCLARVQNRHYVSGCYVGMLVWHLITAFYSYSPWNRCGLMVAGEPWSGHYDITEPLWAIAHTTQFVQPGWRFLKHGNGVGSLALGGSYVTYTNGSDFSIVVEKMDPKDSKCARGHNPEQNTSNEIVTFELGGHLATVKSLKVWFSNFSSDKPADSDQFQQLADVHVIDGKITLTVPVNTIYTLTTTTGQQKGVKTIPASEPFPTPYNDDFEGKPLHQNGKYFYDWIGAWEVLDSGDASHGQAMRQMTPICPLRWWTTYAFTPAVSTFGPPDLLATTISVDFKLESEGGFYFGPRNGPVVKMSSSGLWDYYKGGHPKPGQKSSLSGSLPSDLSLNTWHTMNMTQDSESTTSVTLNGKHVTTLTSPMKSGGLTIGIDDWFHVWVDNLKIARPLDTIFTSTFV